MSRSANEKNSGGKYSAPQIKLYGGLAELTNAIGQSKMNDNGASPNTKTA